jgi:hypothetical protein
MTPSSAFSAQVRVDDLRSRAFKVRQPYQNWLGGTLNLVHPKLTQVT